MKVPFFGVAHEYQAHRQEMMELIDEVLSSGQVLQGPSVEGLEQHLASLARRKHAVAVGSCTDALYFALLALGIRPGDEVLVTSFSFIASASAIVRAGATPVFVDVDETCNMDLKRAEARLTSRCRALICVHLYGLMIPPSRVEEFARAHGLKLVEDAAQAVGSAYQDRPAGSVGDISCMSFDPTKVISAPGSGGVALTDDPALAQHLRRLRYHGRNDRRRFQELGFNSQMPSLTAAVLDRKLTYLDGWLRKRREIAAFYLDHLKGLPVELPHCPGYARHNYHKFVIRTGRRNELRSFLKERSVETMVHYPEPLYRHPLFAELADPDERFSRACVLAETVLSLPIHPFLSDSQVEYVVDSIGQFFE